MSIKVVFIKKAFWNSSVASAVHTSRQMLKLELQRRVKTPRSFFSMKVQFDVL